MPSANTGGASLRVRPTTPQLRTRPLSPDLDDSRPMLSVIGPSERFVQNATRRRETPTDSAMSKFYLILGTLAWVLVYHLAGSIWGMHGKLTMLGIGLAIWIGASIYIARTKRYIRKMCEPDEAEAMIADLDEPDIQGLKLTAPQTFFDGILGIAFFFVPPVVVSLIREESITWESPFTVWHLGSLFVGLFAYLVLRPRIFRSPLDIVDKSLSRSPQHSRKT
jgi:hypothetical protein